MGYSASDAEEEKRKKKNIGALGQRKSAENRKDDEDRSQRAIEVAPGWVIQEGSMLSRSLLD
ncbi:MAG: hypothetical protein M3N46_08115, partial [Actinomycetota bacterium]|nr:hypothetical protein [Actinomycetota bacterium]